MTQYPDLNHFHWTLRPTRERRRRRISIIWAALAVNALLFVMIVAVALTVVSR